MKFNVLNSEFYLFSRLLSNSWFYSFDSCFNLLTRRFNVTTPAFNLPTCAFNLAARAFNLLTRAFELVTRGFELVTYVFELLTRNSCFTFPQPRAFKSAEFAPPLDTIKRMSRTTFSGMN